MEQISATGINDEQRDVQHSSSGSRTSIKCRLKMVGQVGVIPHLGPPGQFHTMKKSVQTTSNQSKIKPQMQLASGKVKTTKNLYFIIMGNKLPGQVFAAFLPMQETHKTIIFIVRLIDLRKYCHPFLARHQRFAIKDATVAIEQFPKGIFPLVGDFRNA
ncbi:MAG: hypothetical protein WBN97_11415 [Parvibaculum sp.]